MTWNNQPPKSFLNWAIKIITKFFSSLYAGYILVMTLLPPSNNNSCCNETVRALANSKDYAMHSSLSHVMYGVILVIVVQTDRRNRFRNVLSKTFRMIYDTPIKAENYLATRKTMYLPRYTKGGGGHYSKIDSTEACKES